MNVIWVCHELPGTLTVITLLKNKHELAGTLTVITLFKNKRESHDEAVILREERVGQVKFAGYIFKHKRESHARTNMSWRVP